MSHSFLRPGIAVIVALGLAFSMLTPVDAQKGSRRDLKELKNRYDKLKQKEFFTRITWHESLKKALKDSKEKNLPVLCYFTRCDRDWPPSQEKEDITLLSQWFMDASDRFVPYINITTGGLNFPEEAMKDKVLGKRSVLPYFVLLDARATEITRFVMNEPEELEKALGEAEELLEARSAVKANKRDKVAKANLALIEGMRVEKPNLKSLKKAASTPGVRPELLERYKTFAAEIPVQEILFEMGKAMEKEQNKGETADLKKVRFQYSEEMYELYLKKGIRITDRGSRFYEEYWTMVFHGAVLRKNRPVAIKAFETFEKTFGHRDSHKPKVRKMKETLRGI